MQDKIKFLAPAKVNLFLKVFNKRKDGYHNIRSGITFINLYDEINVEIKDKTSIKYFGKFTRKDNYSKDCIIKKTLNFLNLDKKINLEITIEKNIPVQAGLGAASSNAAAFIKALEKLNLIKMNEINQDLSILGADVPVCYYGQNALVTGIGENIIKQTYPKYFFLLVKPKVNFSTKNLFNKVKYNSQLHKVNLNYREITQTDHGNDFEEIAIQENREIGLILNFLHDIEENILVRMTGSGSCCYAVFDKKEYAINGQQIFNKKFPNLWSFVAENNAINN
tara:strand:+ start:776 stop:1615 length:840 start_codon:yes stop_codon:yes gene_type:complete